MASQSIVHCWASYREWLEEHDPDNPLIPELMVHDRICVREYGHDGPHEWVDSRDIVIDFGGAPDD